MGIIKNGKDTPVNVQTGTVPDLSGALTDWYQPMTFTQVTKSVVAGFAKEVRTDINFRGIIMPLKPRDLFLKPEGQRAWTWFQLYSDTALELNVDEVVVYRGVQTRIMARKDYTIYGYMDYQLVQDWTGAGPI